MLTSDAINWRKFLFGQESRNKADCVFSRAMLQLKKRMLKTWIEVITLYWYFSVTFIKCHLCFKNSAISQMLYMFENSANDICSYSIAELKNGDLKEICSHSPWENPLNNKVVSFFTISYLFFFPLRVNFLSPVAIKPNSN